MVKRHHHHHYQLICVLSPEFLDRSVIYACVGAELALPWNASLSSRHFINQVMWFHKNPTEDMIAVAVRDNFMPTPAYTGRVQQTTNAGIILNNLTASDKGNYSVQVWLETKDRDIDIWKASVIVSVAGVGTDG